MNDVVKKITWAPAALLYADKASFYDCGFVGIQDTLTDLQGRHFFYNCYIEGAVDFIWGFGQSLYQVRINMVISYFFLPRLKGNLFSGIYIYIYIYLLSHTPLDIASYILCVEFRNTCKIKRYRRLESFYHSTRSRK